MNKKAQSYADIAQELSNAEKQRNKKPKVFEIRDDFYKDVISRGLLYHEVDKAFYRYNNGVYLPITDSELESMVDDFLVSFYSGRVDNSNHMIKEVIDSLIRERNPAHLVKFNSQDTPIRSTFRDCTYNFLTFTKEKHDPEKPSFHAFDFDFPDENLPTPFFDEFLKRTFVDQEGNEDPSLATFVEEVLAYYVSPVHAPKPLGIILTGSGANGKSVLLDILTRLIGQQFISSLSMEDLSEKYGAAELLGKKINIVSEDQSRYIRPDKIKALISRDLIKAERKFVQPFFFKPQAKHIFSSNKEIKFEDIDYAITRRIAIIPHYRTFVPPGGKDPNAPREDGKLVVAINYKLEQGLIDETPAILGRLIKVMKRLAKENYVITIPAAVSQTKKNLEMVSSSALEFIYEHFEYDPTYTELHSTELIYQQYKTWYHETGKPERFLLQPRQFWNYINKNLPGTVTETKTTYMGKKCAAKKFLKPTKFPNLSEFSP